MVPCATLRGQVISQRLGRPLKDVEVVHPHSPRLQERCVTDRYGNFELRRVPIGDVWLNVGPPKKYFGGKSSRQAVDVQADPDSRAKVRIR